jgi:nitrite reductase (NO-forming)
MTASRPRYFAKGETAVLDLGELRGDRQAWCTVGGHRAAGMTMAIRVQDGHGQAEHDAHTRTGEPAPAPAGLDLTADPTPGVDSSRRPTRTGVRHDPPG